MMNKIMIVDDDLHIRELVGVFLKREGIDILEASDGVEALGKLETVNADLVIVDIMMPQLDGWELCCELKANYDLPVLMLTARGETSQKLKGFQLGLAWVPGDRGADIRGIYPHTSALTEKG